jgi:site-specific DNA-methyltransferase (adenine-specific)
MTHARVIMGDCLEVIPRLIADGDSFDLIYVDPPYNAGGSRGARLVSGPRQSGAIAYKDHWGGLDAFLDMLGPRLQLMRAALTDQGSLWVHLDHRTVHEVKVMLDQIFGRAHFQGEIIWVPGNGGKKRHGLPMTHQTILVYTKTDEFLFDPASQALREPYADTSQRMHFRNVDENGRRYRERVIGGKSYRYFADEGRRLGSVWSDCPSMLANTPLRRESTGYPTQKPEALLERIILGASLPTSHVLDPMSGSGTTAYAAMKHGRRATAIDESPVAIEIMGRRLGVLPQKTAAVTDPSPGEVPARTP